MKHPLFDLVSQLESLWLDPETSDVAALSKLLEERQSILTLIQKADASGLDRGTREALAGRIKAVQDRDEELLAAVRKRCDKILEALEGVVHVRTAVRGYKPSEGEFPHHLERIA